MESQHRALGIDIGSVAVKLVLIEDGEVVRSCYRRFEEGPFETLRHLLQTDFSDLAGRRLHLGLTGIGGRTAEGIFGGKVFGEIAAVAAGNFQSAPEVRTVIEMGGEDSKLLILDSSARAVLDFAMNAQCAAGTGSFLDQQANRLRISIDDEFGRLALKSTNPPRIAGRCSVFAKSDMIHLQQTATPDHDIVAGLCFAVARNFKSAIARGKKFEPPIAFEGGVAANPGMVRAFTEILGLDDGQLLIPGHYNVIGALGAALLASENGAEVAALDPARIDEYLQMRQVDESGREALSFDYPDSKFYDLTLSGHTGQVDRLNVHLGIDVGSLSTNLVLIDRDRNVIARRYLMTEGRPIEAVRRGLAEIEEEVGDRVCVKAVGTTGSGRYLVGDFVGADIIRNEITAQATAAVAIDPEVDTIFEIGGQDSKYVSLERQAVVDFEMNKACAAGTGSFLQEQAEKLRINIETEFGDKALQSTCPVGCGERCTVFMESDLVGHQRSGARKEDLIAGLAYSIASNYLTKVVGDRRIGDNIFFQGGVAWNKGVVAAFEKLLGKKVTVPPHHDVTGAIGAAILAMEKSGEESFAGTAFKGFDLHKRQYQLSTFTCEDCSNQCEIRQVEIAGEAPLYYGSRCEKYEVDRRLGEALPPDYAAVRQRLLYKRYVKARRPKKIRARVGIPRVLHYFEYYPFWLAFFEALDCRLVSSDVSSSKIVEDSLELFSAETCFPIKLVYGHVDNLLGKNIDTVFLPSLISTVEEHEASDQAAYVCPYVQMIASSVRARFDFDRRGVKFLTTPIHFSFDANSMWQNLKPLARSLRISDRRLRSAVEAGLRAFSMFKRELVAAGQEFLSKIGPDEKVMVVVSRPYNGCDRRLSLELPKKIRNLGYNVIPVDFLSLDELDPEHSNMYWRYGRRLLAAARFIRNDPRLFAVYLTSFGCGPDSFITHFFRRVMTGKPYLQLELDEHSADAGMITRVEAFIDSLRFHVHRQPTSHFNLTSDRCRPFEKTIFIPHMCDHAYAVSAAFERCGLTAEVLDEPDDETLEYGKRFTSGKECFPCVITTGDMIKRLRRADFDPERSVFFMPGADGPCRFGLYSKYHRVVLDELGHTNIPIFSPNSRDGYADFGLEGTSFRKSAWRGVVFVDCITQLLHRIRPYELQPGQTEKTYLRYLNKLCGAIRNDDDLDTLAAEAAGEFASIETARTDRPVIGVVGEIYLRNNRFSNNHLVEKLEALGMEVWLASFSEWPMYTSKVYLMESAKRRHPGDMLDSILQFAVQWWQERGVFRSFARRLEMRHDLPVGKVLKLARPYIPVDCKGEAILSVGKAIEMARGGVSGIVNAMPFNCMPGTVVSSLSEKLSADLDGVPWLNISYEGLRDSGEDTRLEAFTDQARAYRRRRSAGRKSFSLKST
jgi:predicted CoA-substrate-specific enzyme activase